MRLLRESGTVLGFLALTAFLSIVASAIVARRVGPEIVGALAIGFLLLEFGAIPENLSTSAHIRRTAAASPAEVRGLFTTHLSFKLAFAGIASLGIYLSAAWIASALGADAALFELFAFVPIFGAASSAIHNTLEARGRMVARGAMDVVTASAYLALVIFFVFSGPDAVWGRAVAAASTLAFGVLFFFPGVARPRAAVAREYLSFGARTAPSALVMKTIFWADTAMIAAMVGTAAAGTYQVAYAIAVFQVVGASAVATALFPELSRGVLGGDRTRVVHGFERGFILVAGTVGVTAAFLVVAAPWLVPWLYGQAFAASVPLLQLLALSFLLDSLGLASALALVAHGRPGTVLQIQGAMAAVNVGANLALIPSMGAMGAVVATFLTFGLGTSLQLLAARTILALAPPRRVEAYRRFYSEAMAAVRARFSLPPP